MTSFLYDSFLVDLDGTTYNGSIPLEEAPAALHALWDSSDGKVVYLTNNASRSPRRIEEKLRSMGFPAKCDRILTSAQIGASLLAEYVPAASEVLVVGATYLEECVQERGMTPTRQDTPATQAVIHGHSTETGWKELSCAVRAIRAGARYIATNRDTLLPMDNGVAIGNGAMVAAVEAATGVTAQAAAKPSAGALHHAQRLSGGKKSLVVGDRLDTDIAGGNAANMASWCVLTGVTDIPLLCRAPQQHRPTYCSPTLTALADAMRTGTAWSLDEMTTAYQHHIEVYGSLERPVVHFPSLKHAMIAEPTEQQRTLSAYIAWAWHHGATPQTVLGRTPDDHAMIETWTTE